MWKLFPAGHHTSGHSQWHDAAFLEVKNIKSIGMEDQELSYIAPDVWNLRLKNQPIGAARLGHAAPLQHTSLTAFSEFILIALIQSPIFSRGFNSE